MTELNFNTGRRVFNINGIVEVEFNETDADFVERLFNVFAALDKKQEKYRGIVEKEGDKRKVFEIMRNFDAEIREDIDGLFEQDVCTPLFGRMNVFALADGLPLWANLLLVIMDQIDTAFTREQKATNPRVQKYTAKWQKR